MLMPCPGEGPALEEGGAPGYGAAPSPRKQEGGLEVLFLSAPAWGPGGEGCPLLPSPVRDIFW